MIKTKKVDPIFSVQLLHASILLRPPADDDTQSVSSPNEQIHLGFTFASTLCFAITQIMFSALFSGQTADLNHFLSRFEPIFKTF